MKKTGKGDYHAVSLSGGKDSTAMLLMMIEKGMPVDGVFWADTGMEFPEMWRSGSGLRFPPIWIR